MQDTYIKNEQENCKLMKLITWNTNGRRDIETQLVQLLAHNPDTLCLQEVLSSAVPRWQAALDQVGFKSDFNIEENRKKGVAIASRLPMAGCPTPILPRTDAIIGAKCGGVPVWSVHIPNGAAKKNGRTKIDCMKAVCDAAMAHQGPLIVAGDFNGPQFELKDGTIVTWGQTKIGNIRKRKNTLPGEWDHIERATFEGLPNHGLRDVWRDLNPPLLGESPTWRTYRLDHVFSNIASTSAAHEEGMSDHKMVIVVVTPSTV